MNSSYSDLIQQPLPLIAAERPAQYKFISERHLQAMWFEQKYFRPLITLDGFHIHVISPGLWNADAGPDFRKAHLRIGNREIIGDIEIHLNDENWHHHRHHLDERYNDVILHLSLWQPKEIRPMRTFKDSVITQAYFEPCLTVPPMRLLNLIDLDLYPYKKFLGSGRCAHALFRSLPEKDIQRFFQSAAAHRLRMKSAFLQERVPLDSLQVPAGIAMALGYKNNAEVFLELFLELNKNKHQKEEPIFAQALALCGFFDSQYQRKWGESSYYKTLHNLASSVSTRFKLALNRIRPLNHPVRRLVVLAKMVCDSSLSSIKNRLLDLWQQQWEQIYTSKRGSHELKQQFLSLLPSYEDPYWNCHYTFEEQSRGEFLTLLGPDSKQEMIVNILFPCLYSDIEQRQNVEELTAFHHLYASYPAAYSSKTQYLIHRFFGDTPKGDLLKRGDIEQGAYQLHRDFCVSFEASCEGCPFVDRYQANFC